MAGRNKSDAKDGILMPSVKVNRSRITLAKMWFMGDNESTANEMRRKAREEEMTDDVQKRKPDLFDAAAAREARDEGMAKVEGSNPDWMANAMKAGRSLPRGWEGTGEDIRVALTMGGLSKPHHHNVWGAFINNMVREGWLEWTTALRNMQTERSHARATKVYRKVR